MINKQTGHITISDRIHIKPDDLYQDILSLNLGQTNKQLDHGNGWSWLQENNVFVDNKFFIIQFGFFKNELKQISLCMNDTKFKLDKGWDNWSEEKELADLEKYKEWLTNELGQQKEFAWGTVWASYDSKGGSSSIGIRYK